MLPALRITADLPSCIPALESLARLRSITLDASSSAWHLHLPASGAITLTEEGHELFALPAPQRLSALADALDTALHQWQQRPIPLGAGWVLSPTRRACLHENHGEIDLTDKEYALLLMLWQEAGNIIPRDTLVARIWAHESGVDSHTLETHIYRLRGKCEQLQGLSLEIRAENDGYSLILP